MDHILGKDIMAYPDRGLHGHVVRAVGRRIVSGAIEPGTRFNTDALEVEFDVSKTVIRESLKVLAAKGLIDARPRRGTYVRPRSEWSLLDPDLLRWQVEGTSKAKLLDDLAEVRQIVEPAAARLAALRRTEKDLVELETALASVGPYSTAAQITEADLRFHRALLSATRNNLLQRMEYVIEIVLHARDLLVHADGHRDDFMPPHVAVLDAVRASDPDAAEAAMRRLLHQAAIDARVARDASPPLHDDRDTEAGQPARASQAETPPESGAD